ncbi:glycosyltransferase [Xanthomonadaceae bacterium JHOS43]|nr:glycosyltransferase [Xanthomonadaceae bacterium JHOS43]
MMAFDKPLVSFIVFTYNQENFVAKAVEAAFAQTYSPLEIILSDDSSRDSTAVIIRELAGRYRGPHKVIVNVNEKNLGIGAHINQALGLANGEFLTLAAGDDISKPERTEILVEAWLRKDRCAGAFYSGHEDMDKNGEMLGVISVDPERYIFPRNCVEKNVVVGATEAWSRSIFDTFGPLHPSIIHEDRVVALRASLLGGLHYVDQPLVAYRRGGISTSSAAGRIHARRINSHRYVVDSAHMICDIELARRKNILSDDDASSLQAVAGNRIMQELFLIRTKSLFLIPAGLVIDALMVLKRAVFVVYKLIVS